MRELSRLRQPCYIRWAQFQTFKAFSMSWKYVFEQIETAEQKTLGTEEKFLSLPNKSYICSADFHKLSDVIRAIFFTCRLTEYSHIANIACCQSSNFCVFIYAVT